MNTGDLSSGNDHSARPGSSSRREFLGRTIRGGALLAATSVLGSELRLLPKMTHKPQTKTLPQIPPQIDGATTADLLVEKLVEWGVPMVLGLPGDKNAWILNALRRRQDRSDSSWFVTKRVPLSWPAGTLNLRASWVSASARRVRGSTSAEWTLRRKI